MNHNDVDRVPKKAGFSEERKGRLAARAKDSEGNVPVNVESEDQRGTRGLRRPRRKKAHNTRWKWSVLGIVAIKLFRSLPQSTWMGMCWLSTSCDTRKTWTRKGQNPGMRFGGSSLNGSSCVCHGIRVVVKSQRVLPCPCLRHYQTSKSHHFLESSAPFAAFAASPVPPPSSSPACSCYPPTRAPGSPLS